MIAVLAIGISPLLIILFAAGRITMLLMSAGVHAMPKFSCSSQGLVFPQARVGDLGALACLRKATPMKTKRCVGR